MRRGGESLKLDEKHEIVTTELGVRFFAVKTNGFSRGQSTFASKTNCFLMFLSWAALGWAGPAMTGLAHRPISSFSSSAQAALARTQAASQPY